MAEQALTTKQTYQAYLRGEASFEAVAASARETLQRHIEGLQASKNAKSS